MQIGATDKKLIRVVAVLLAIHFASRVLFVLTPLARLSNQLLYNIDVSTGVLPKTPPAPPDMTEIEEPLDSSPNESSTSPDSTQLLKGPMPVEVVSPMPKTRPTLSQRLAADIESATDTLLYTVYVSGMFVAMSLTGRFLIPFRFSLPASSLTILSSLISVTAIVIFVWILRKYDDLPVWKRAIYGYLIATLISGFSTLTFLPD